MLQRTHSFMLLLLLVVTGLAGRIHSDPLSIKERRFLLTQLKESKAAYLKSIKGLSEAQLVFRPEAGRWTIKECIQHLALSEETLWKMADTQLKSPANPDQRTAIQVTDDGILQAMRDRSEKRKTFETLEPNIRQWRNTEEAINEFKDKREALMRYVKTTTDDMRSHVAMLDSGPMDTYQVLLLIAGHTDRHTAQINEVKAHPSFPKK